ncbi:MAG TPA: hypothetical protein PLR86_08525, partial [Planctomycetota bacterium]|nr:hypothetical protein [Planctomycetota bacterium]
GKIDTPNPKSGSKFQYDTYQFRHSPHTPVEKLPEQFKNVSKQYPSFYNDQNMEFINQNLPFQYSHCTKLWDDWQNTKTEEPNYIGYSTLKCVDASAYLNINLPYRGNHNSASYERMLQNLLQIIQVKESGHLQGAFQISNIISKIFAKRQEFSNQFSNHQREKDGYNDLGELSHLVESGAISQINLDIFSRYLTVDSWGHKNYVPYALNIQEGIDSIYENIDYEKNELMHPINLNVASEEILTVVFEGITAVHKNRKGESFNTIISKLVAQTLAKNIVSDRQKKSDNLGNSSCFRNWNEVEAYLLNKLTKPQAHAIFSAIYPGMLQNKKTPDIAHHRTFDRLDIAKGNVECCLFSPGIFYFEAISRIVPRKGAPIIANRPYENLAQSKQTANIQLWEPHIVNTQHDFEHERQNKNSAETAWSGIISKTPSSTEWSPNISPENIGDGYLFERNPHNNTDCTLFSWASREVNNEICERRPDGVYMKSYKHPQIITNQKDIWNEEGFNFWIKPGYNLQANYDPNDSGQGDENKYVIEDEILIAVAKHTTPWPGSIITRCAYDWKTHDSTTNAPYLTLSRTFVYNNPPGNTERNEKNFRTFFNAPVNDNIKKLLRNKAPIAEHAVAWYVFKAHLRPKRCIGYEMDNVLQFHAEFIDKTYNTMTEGTPNFIKIDCTVLGYKLNGSTVTHSTTVTFHLEHPWTQMTIDNIRMPIKDGTDVLTIWPLIFDPKQVSDIKPVPEQCNPDHDDANEVSNPETNTKIGYYALYQSPVRNTQQREATDIKQFEDDPIHHEFLKYSRVERRIPIKLRRGHWYHIQGRWEKDRIYIKDFTVHEGEPFQNSLQQEAPPMKMTRGPLLKNLMSGPLRTWAFNGIEVYKNKGTQENTDLNIKNLNDLQNNKI